MVDLADAIATVTALPGVQERSVYGRQGWSVGDGKAFAWVRPFTKADLRRFGDREPPAGPILALRLADLEEKDAVLAASGQAVFTIAHLDGYPAVLVALDAVDADELRELVLDAWLAVAPEDRARDHLGWDPAD